jgi:Septum formation
MWRSGKLAMACAVALFTLVACGSAPAGVDKDLIDDWPAMAQAVTPEPATETCYSEEFTETWSGDFASRTVACSAEHWTETTYVGKLSGTVAGRDIPPLSGSSDLTETFKSCADKTQGFLGGNWQTGYLWLGVTLPGKAAWKGGARWYRCEVVGLGRDIDQDFTKLTGSAKGALASKGPLARTCSLVQTDSSGSIKSDNAVDCSKPHNAEFAGLYTLSGSTYPTGKALEDKASAACQKVYTSFLGVPPSRSHYFGWTWHNITEEQWNLGIRTGLCSVIGFSGSSVNNVRFTGSVKGTGDRKPTGWRG